MLSRRPDYEGEPQAAAHLLPILQNKLAVWGGDADLAPMVGRIRVQGNARPVRNASNQLPYIGPRTIVRAIVNATSCSKDPFRPIIEDLTSLIRKLQSQDATLPELLRNYCQAGVGHA